MNTANQGLIGHGEQEAVSLILGRLFEHGRTWIKGIQTNDWRWERYADRRRNRNSGADWPANADIVDQAKTVMDYVLKTPSTATGQEHFYFLVKPDSGCNSEQGVPLLRPVLKTNTEGTPTLNFHVWFHLRQPGGQRHFMHGWRLEAPERQDSDHNFYHAQPLRKYGRLEQTFTDALQPDKFPTMPVLASNAVELCMCAVTFACGKAALRELAKSSDIPVRDAARSYMDKLAFRA